MVAGALGQRLGDGWYNTGQGPRRCDCGNQIARARRRDRVATQGTARRSGASVGTTIGGLSYGAESPEGMKLAIDQYIAPILKSANPARVPETMIAIRKAIKGNNFAKCAVETALLDAWGKRISLPVSELVGGRLRDRLPVAWTLASGDAAVDIAEAEQMLERKRHNAFKLKIGRRSIDEDVAHVAEVKRALPVRLGQRFGRPGIARAERGSISERGLILALWSLPTTQRCK